MRGLCVLVFTPLPASLRMALVCFLCSGWLSTSVFSAPCAYLFSVVSFLLHVLFPPSGLHSSVALRLWCILSAGGVFSYFATSLSPSLRRAGPCPFAHAPISSSFTLPLPRTPTSLSICLCRSFDASAASPFLTLSPVCASLVMLHIVYRWIFCLLPSCSLV